MEQTPDLLAKLPLVYFPLMTNPFAHSSPSEIQMNNGVSSLFNSAMLKPVQAANFTINKILGDSITDIHANTTQALLPMLGFNQQRSLVDTAKILWLQRFAHPQNLSNPHNHRSSPSSHDERKQTKKRKLGRNPRIPFTQQQIEYLEQKYLATRYLSSVDVVSLSKELDLSEARVKIWFQNRRARERRDNRTNLSLSVEQMSANQSLVNQLNMNHMPNISALKASHTQS